jgi:DNA-binding Lrp family transcriptional regulator
MVLELISPSWKIGDVAEWVNDIVINGFQIVLNKNYQMFYEIQISAKYQVIVCLFIELVRW